MESARKSHISGPIPRYRKLYEGERWQPSKDDPSWDPDLPYGGKVYLARKKLPQTLFVTILEVVAIVLVLWAFFFSFYYFDHLHFHVARSYAYLGYDTAQHRTGQHYLSGRGVEKDPKLAMHYFKQAADQGHPHASHNLAVGHLKGYHTLPKGEAHRLIQHAAKHGVPEAHDALNNVCIDGGCD